MKLSFLGMKKLMAWASNDIKGDLKDLEFEQKDFKGAVILTINQAKELATKLQNNADFFFLQTGEFDYDTDELWQCLTDKIEQAEINHAKGDI